MENRQALTFATFLILFGAFVIGIMSYYASSDERTHVTPALLNAQWHAFKQDYVETSTGRTVSQDSLDSTSSQDQSFTMLRAVWMNDQETFNQAWNWAKIYLKQKDSNLFSSHYGKRADGSYGISAEGVATSSGADSDVALSLLFAYARWGQLSYQEAAREIMDDIWDKEVITIAGRPYLLADSAQKFNNQSVAVINPSSFVFYAFHIFAEIDERHDWGALIDTSYEMLDKSTIDPLDKKKSGRIPPDFLAIDKTTGDIRPLSDKNRSTDFKHEAFRIAWRLALDWQWFKDTRSRSALTNFVLLQEEWRDQGKLYAVYNHEGKALTSEEDPAVYGGTIGYFMVTDNQSALRIQDMKLASLYDQEKDAWKEPQTSKSASWVWLGLSLTQNSLPNLFPQTAIDQMQDQFVGDALSVPVSESME